MAQLTPPIIFWSQNLENQGEDLVVIWNGTEWEGVTDIARQQQMVEKVSKVRREGTCLHKATNPELRVDFAAQAIGADPGRFILDVETQVEDEAGRVSFFVCYASAGNIGHPKWSDELWELIENFGATYNRLSAVERLHLDDALRKIRDKKKHLKILRLTMLVGVMGLALGLGWWIRGL